MRVFGAAVAVVLLLGWSAAAAAEPARVSPAEPSIAAAPEPVPQPEPVEVHPALINPAQEMAGPQAPSEPSPDTAAAAPMTPPAPSEATSTVTTDPENAEPAPPPPEPTLVVDINLTNQRMTVSENGETKHTWAISSAAAGYQTPTGTFSPSWMSRMWYSRQYDWAPMPHAIFFERGVAIHATNAIRMLGRPASHGCVRLAPANAAALYKLVGTHGKSMTKIVVHGTPRHGNVIARGYGDYDFQYNTTRRRNSYWSNYSYYSAPPSYYYPPRANRRAGTAPYYYPRPRRYVSRGLLYSPGYRY